MELAKRFRGMLADLGLKPLQAAKLLHVSLRTVHNWTAGKHQIPVMAYKTLRMLRYMELPGASWQGWHFSRGMLITPEGHQLTGKDGSWWSLLVRRAAMFDQTARENQRLRNELAAKPPNLLLEHFTTNDNSSQKPNGVIMGSWPTTSESLQPSISKPEPAVNGSASASTPSSVSPWTPTCENQPLALRVLPAPFLPARGLPLAMSLRYRLQQNHQPPSSQSSNAGNSLPLSGTPKSTKTVHGGVL
jgi:Phage protein